MWEDLSTVGRTIPWGWTLNQVWESELSPGTPAFTLTLLLTALDQLL